LSGLRKAREYSAGAGANLTESTGWTSGAGNDIRQVKNEKMRLEKSGVLIGLNSTAEAYSRF
jgi:hypothetical protein